MGRWVKRVVYVYVGARACTREVDGQRVRRRSPGRPTSAVAELHQVLEDHVDASSCLCLDEDTKISWGARDRSCREVDRHCSHLPLGSIHARCRPMGSAALGCPERRNITWPSRLETIGRVSTGVGAPMGRRDVVTRRRAYAMTWTRKMRRGCGAMMT